MYYGQFNPPNDWLIERFFPPEFVGHCVEVGAVDGLICSNTLYFEQKGWSCLCIEPNPFYHQTLAGRRKLAMPYAISDQNVDGVPLYRVKVNDNYDAVTSLQLDPRLIRDHQHLITESDTVTVNMRTLDACLEVTQWSKLDFASIDTEGTELAVLRGFTLERWKPRLLVIENNYSVPEIEAYLQPRGYLKALRHEVNDFYLRAIQ
jgi:FkbM family methyltransferase